MVRTGSKKIDKKNMQKLILLFVAFLTITATFGKTDNAAIDYNDRIVTEQNKIGNQILEAIRTYRWRGLSFNSLKFLSGVVFDPF